VIFATKKQIDHIEENTDIVPIGSYWQLVRRKFLSHKLAFFGLIVLTMIVLLVVVGPFLVRVAYDEMDFTALLVPPLSSGHILGTDELGRDVFARLLYGGRISLLVGVCSSLISTGIGLLVGLFSGYFGGIVDRLLMRFVDVMLSIPSFPVLLILTLVFGPGLFNTISVLAIFGWMGVARLVRSVVLSVRENDFIMAARVAGTKKIQILFRHIMPNVIPITIVSATLNLSYAILAESSLSYLGLGIQPPTPSWGNMLQKAMTYILSKGHASQTPWWLIFFPGFMIFLVVLSVNFLGDGLRDALDPRFVSES